MEQWQLRSCRVQGNFGPGTHRSLFLRICRFSPCLASSWIMLRDLRHAANAYPSFAVCQMRNNTFFFLLSTMLRQHVMVDKKAWAPEKVTLTSKGSWLLSFAMSWSCEFHLGTLKLEKRPSRCQFKWEMVWRRFEVLRALAAWWMGRKFDGNKKVQLMTCRVGAGAGAGGQKNGNGLWYVPRTECGLREWVWIRNIMKVKHIHHNVCYSGLEFEIEKCFFSIKALAGWGGHGDRF